MSVDPSRDERLEVLLREIGRTLQENRVFLEGIQRGDGAGDELVSDHAAPDDEEYEEL